MPGLKGSSMTKRKITMTIDDKIFSDFKELCASKAMKVSSKVELMMKKFVENSEEEGDSNE